MNNDPSQQIGNRRLAAKLAPLIAIAALSACATGPRPEISEESTPFNTEVKTIIEPSVSAPPTLSIDPVPTVPKKETGEEILVEFQNYLSNESRNDEIGDFVSDNVQRLYNILQQSKDTSISITVNEPEEDDAKTEWTPFILFEGELGGDHYRIISFGKIDETSTNIFTDDNGNSVSMIPETIMIDITPDATEEDTTNSQKIKPGVFIGFSAETGNYTLSYTDLVRTNDGVYYDSSVVTDNGVLSYSVDVNEPNTSSSGGNLDVQLAKNVEDYARRKVVDTIGEMKLILGGRVTLPESE